MKKIDLFNDANPLQVEALKDSVRVTNEALLGSKYKIDVKDAIVRVFSRNDKTVDEPVFMVALAQKYSRDLYFKSECEHGDDVAWCEHLEVFFGLRMDRPLIAMLVGRKVRLITPVYPKDNFGLVLLLKGEDDGSQIDLELALRKGSKQMVYEVGSLDHIGSVKTIKNMLEDLIYYISETGDLPSSNCVSCDRGINSPDFTAQDMWMLTVNGTCGLCAGKQVSFDDVIPELDGGQYAEKGHVGNAPTSNQIASGMIDMKKFSTGKFEGNTHGK